MDVVNHSSMALASDVVVKKNVYKIKHMTELLIRAVPDPQSYT